MRRLSPLFLALFFAANLFARLPPGAKFSLSDGHVCRIENFLGEGGFGEIYSAVREPRVEGELASKISLKFFKASKTKSQNGKRAELDIDSLRQSYHRWNLLSRNSSAFVAASPMEPVGLLAEETAKILTQDDLKLLSDAEQKLNLDEAVVMELADGSSDAIKDLFQIPLTSVVLLPKDVLPAEVSHIENALPRLEQLVHILSVSLAELLKEGLAHDDIKPANLLFFGPNPLRLVVADPDFLQTVGNRSLGASAAFLPPEEKFFVLSTDSHIGTDLLWSRLNLVSTHARDFFAAALTVYQLLIADNILERLPINSFPFMVDYELYREAIEFDLKTLEKKVHTLSPSRSKSLAEVTAFVRAGLQYDPEMRRDALIRDLPENPLAKALMNFKGLFSFSRCEPLPALIKEYFDRKVAFGTQNTQGAIISLKVAP